MRRIKRLASVLLLAVLALTMTGCHGSIGQQALRIPETFDESRSYEITFWAKNDTNKTQAEIYDRAIA